MKKTVIICIIFALLMSVTMIPAFAEEETAEEQNVYGSHGLDAPDAIMGKEQLIENAQSVILYETISDTLMYAWNPDLPVEPAGLVKIMTALVALEQGSLTDAVTVKADVLSTVPVSEFTVDLKPDEVMTLENLLYCMLVSSADDAATVIADYVGGNQMLFIGEMNRYAENLGCENTLFTNVTGAYDERQHTSARDMARIIREACKNEDFCKMFGAESYIVPATNKSDERELITRNFLMSKREVDYCMDNRVVGGQTAMANDKTRCVAVSAKSGGLETICVIFGSESEYTSDGIYVITFGGYQETSDLLDLALNKRQRVQVLYNNQAILQQSVTNGDCDVVLGVKDSAITVLPKDISSSDLTYKYSHTESGLKAPITCNDIVSSVEVYYGTVCVGKSDLYALNQVSVATNQELDSRFIMEETNITQVLLWIGIIVACVVVLAVLFRVIRRIRIVAAERNSRMHRRNRRRS